MAVKVVGDILRADAGVTALLGVGNACRVYPLTLPQNAVMPAVTVQRVAATPENALGGFSNLTGNRVQVDVYADNYPSVVAVAAACATALRTAGHVLVSELDDYNPEVDEFRVIQDYEVWQ